MKSRLITALLVIALFTSSSGYGHHSAAGIDRTKTVTVEGTVKQFKWGNPHSWLEVEVQNTKGGSDIWNFEMNPPAYLVRSGWKSTSVKAGDKVKVTGRPSTNCQMNRSNDPNSSCTSRNDRAFATADSTLSRFRMIPGSSSSFAIRFSEYRAIFAGSNASNAFR